MIFECVGVPGMIDDVISGAPLFSRVVVVGVCMDKDAIRPAMAINKEIDLRFVLAYTPLEYRDTLHMLAREGGRVTAGHGHGRAGRRGRRVRAAGRGGHAREDPDRPAQRRSHATMSGPRSVPSEPVAIRASRAGVAHELDNERERDPHPAPVAEVHSGDPGQRVHERRQGSTNSPIRGRMKVSKARST